MEISAGPLSCLLRRESKGVADGAPVAGAQPLAGHGALRLVLAWKGRELASFPLETLLVFSLGKPWELQGPERGALEKAQVKRRGSSMVIEVEHAFASIDMSLQLSFDSGRLVMDVSWTNGGKDLTDAVLGLAFPVEGQAFKTTLPHCIYNDNPSADPSITIPRIGKIAGEGYICEEHRLPIPGFNLQWQLGDAHPHLSVLWWPSLLSEEDIDSCWSAGFLKTEGGYSGLILSGALMFNGAKDVTYGGQCSPLPYPGGYFRFSSGATVRKRLELSWGDEVSEGQGFRDLVWQGWDLFDPQPQPAMTVDELIRLKFQCLDSRFREDEGSSGYSCFGTANGFGNISKRPEYYLYAWTGEALKLAWCDAHRGLAEGDEKRLERASRSVDFFVAHSRNTASGLPLAYYLYERDQWGGAWFDVEDQISSRMVGCSLSDLMDYMELLRSAGREVPGSWEGYARSVCEILKAGAGRTADGVFPLKWRLDASPAAHIYTAAGVPCATALSKGGVYFNDPDLTASAEYALERYYELTARTMERPFAYSTLDASCEDKEAGMYFFSSCLQLYRNTGKDKYLDWAGIAADWIMTFQYVWEPPVRVNSAFAKSGFRILGWPGVSPQNHHLDVFFPALDLMEYGKLVGEERYGRSGRAVLDAWTHGVCVDEGDFGFSVPGEQSEQLYHTNYYGARYPEIHHHIHQWRGGIQIWNPSWITAEVLQAALRFEDCEAYRR